MPNAVEPPTESPTRLEAAYALLAEATADGGRPWRPLAGGTDLMVQLAGEIGAPPERILDIWGLDELRGISVEADALVLGALTTYTELRRSPVVAELVPVLAEAAATIGAAQIQNRGTIGGNVVNASPAGDTLPVLLALDAEIVLGSAGGERTVPASEFWPSYRTTARRDEELVVRIRIPIVADRQVRFRKVGTRRAQAISKVVMALAWRAVSDDAAWTDVRVALGSVAATPIRASATEAALEGARPTAETADRAREALEAEIHPIDDVRSTADYRRLVAGRVLHRLIRDEGGW
ncbi:MAG TPA: xanthine dehydrogenase family protein subunit M [Candidatus Limnocylindria bacterium]|nr:xanthine dehydrogenase family protein subunit M [Candidatus Limnocylindria bacterium]